MKCYHYMAAAPEPAAWRPRVWHSLQLPNGSYFVCHGGECPDPPTALGHLLLMQKVTREVATALKSYGVHPSDTLAAAAIKMAKVIPGFMP